MKKRYLTRREAVQGACAIFILTLAGCSDDDEKPNVSASDTKQTYDPFATDEDDKALNRTSDSEIGEWGGEWIDVEESFLAMGSEDFSAAGVERCTTYHSTRMNSGRRLWKINSPLWKYAKYASIRFSDGYYVPRVVLSKANRTRSGFVCRPGHTTANIIAIWAPRGDKSTAVTVCLQ